MPAPPITCLHLYFSLQRCRTQKRYPIYQRPKFFAAAAEENQSRQRERKEQLRRLRPRASSSGRWPSEKQRPSPPRPPRGTWPRSRLQGPRACGPSPRRRSGPRALVARRGGGGGCFFGFRFRVSGDAFVEVERERRRNLKQSPTHVLFWTAESCASSGSAERAAATAAATAPAAEEEEAAVLVFAAKGR